MTLSPPLLALLYLGAAAWVATLHLSFRQAGDAGISRFLEKYPAMARYAFWTRRWPQLCATLLIILAGLFIAALWSLIPVFTTASTGQAVMGWIGLVMLAIMALHVFPMALAESYSDRITSVALPYVAGLTAILFPLAFLIALIENQLIRLFRSQSRDGNRPSSEDEIISLVDDANAGDLEETEREMIRSILEFGETVTREIMTHRIDINAFEYEASIADCIERSKQSTFSRFPVYAGSLDDVRGVVHVKDLMRSLSENNGADPIASLCNKVTFVPESMPIDDLFRLMRTAHAHLAMVVDEYGGTAGLVSMEDIIEELVGEIHDEYDAAENKIQSLPDGSYLVDAREPVYEVNQTLKIAIPEDDDYDSVGGFIFHKLGQIPSPGEIIDLGDLEIRIQTAVPNRIINVRITRKAGAAPATS
jgi:putative hemolysin